MTIAQNVETFKSNDSEEYLCSNTELAYLSTHIFAASSLHGNIRNVSVNVEADPVAVLKHLFRQTEVR